MSEKIKEDKIQVDQRTFYLAGAGFAGAGFAAAGFASVFFAAGFFVPINIHHY